MAVKYEIEWTEEASADLEKIYNFLLLTWCDRKAEEFLIWFLSSKKLSFASRKLLNAHEKLEHVTVASYIRIQQWTRSRATNSG